MSKKFYLNILRAGVYLSLICIFFVFHNLLFPFITSKQIPFNILIEVLFVFWLVFLFKYPEYKPKWSYITFGMVAFFTIATISCFTGVDFNLSFWGDVERMLGVFHILHFFVLYLIVITVFREWRDWKMLFIFSIVFALFISWVGINRETHSTIGNTAYVSGYLIFAFYFTLLLFFKEKSDFRYIYLLPNIFYAIEFNKLDTTGAFVGFGFSLIFLGFLLGVLHKNKKIKIATFLFAVFISLFAVWALNNRDNPIVKNTPLIKNIRGVNIHKNTFQTRLISWKAGLKGIKEHPFLGTGFGNFAIIFDKYFDPSFYDYTRSETYFDRAHNNLIDIASTTGLLGLFAYLSIFIAVAFYLIKYYRQGKIKLVEFVLISSLLVAYFVQNLAVFDSFATYLYLMLILAYVYWLANKRGDEDNLENFSFDDYLLMFILPILSLFAIEVNKISFFAKNNVNVFWFIMAVYFLYIVYQIFLQKQEKIKISNKEIFTFFIVGSLMLILIYQINIKSLNMLIGTIKGQIVAGDRELMIETYKKALANNSVISRDSRTSLIRSFSFKSDFEKIKDPQKRQEAIDYIISLAEKNVAYNPHDSLAQMMLAQVLNAASSFYRNDPEKFAYYSDRALEAINKSIEASPKRVPIYYQKANIYMTRGEKDKVIETLKYAYDLHPAYWDSACHLGQTYEYFGNQEEADKYIGECIDLGGANLLSPAGYVKSKINKYVEEKNWDRVIKLYQRLTVLEKNNADNWVKLAKLYFDKQEYKKAKKAVEKAVELSPPLEKYAEKFMAEIEAKIKE